MSAPSELGIARLVLDARAALGECPLWSSSEQVLYWVDIAGRSIHRFDPRSGIDQAWQVPSEPGCIALAKSGGLVAALRDGLYRFEPGSGRLEKIADAPYDPAQFRFNDGRCDARGRFWAGAMWEPRSAERASMYCLERGALREAWGPAQGWGVRVSNGLAFSADGRSLWQSDTPSHVIYQFDFDLASGAVSNRRTFARLPGIPGTPGYGGRPDGAAIDREGAYWSAQYEGGRVLRLSPDGDCLAVVRVPALRATMVAFGGEDLRTLYVTTARQGCTGEELASHPASGGLFAFPAPVAGYAEPSYEEPA
jgi:sugar lactone lactonase YvrE